MRGQSLAAELALRFLWLAEKGLCQAASAAAVPVAGVLAIGIRTPQAVAVVG